MTLGISPGDMVNWNSKFNLVPTWKTPHHVDDMGKFWFENEPHEMRDTTEPRNWHSMIMIALVAGSWMGESPDRDKTNTSLLLTNQGLVWTWTNRLVKTWRTHCDG